MVRGFVVEHMQAGASAVEAWVEGPPKVSVWTRLKLPLLGKLPVATFRCESCGFLESYARKEFKAK